MNKSIILITGAVLTSSEDSINTYSKLVSFIGNKQEVSSPLDTMQFKGNDVERYERAMNLVKKSKLVIAEMSQVSTGQGMELQEAANHNFPILVIAKKGSKVSGLVKGCRMVKDIVFYDEIEDVKENVLNFIRENEKENNTWKR